MRLENLKFYVYERGQTFNRICGQSSKTFVELKPFPKNREPRARYNNDEIMDILKRRKSFKLPKNDFVFHVDGRPINYATVQVNYSGAQRKSGIPYSENHILRHVVSAKQPRIQVKSFLRLYTLDLSFFRFLVG